jgi:hypothetical protein
MRNTFRRASAILSALACLAPAAFAAGRPDRPGTEAKKNTVRAVGTTTSIGVPVGSQTTTILGSAWTATNQPLPNPRIRLRDIITGAVVARATGDAGGLFSFEDVIGGSYVVELVNESGKTLVVGHMFTIAQGETVATFVRLGTKVPAFAAFFGNALTAVAATAAAQGITAITPVARPVSANQ